MKNKLINFIGFLLFISALVCGIYSILIMRQVRIHFPNHNPMDAINSLALFFLAFGLLGLTGAVINRRLRYLIFTLACFAYVALIVFVLPLKI